MGLFSSSEFDELSLLVEKATSEYIPAAQEDLALNLEVTDVIKSKRVAPKDALRLLLSRLTHDNPNVQLLSLQLFDKCVKNAGKHFLVEMAGREFVDVAVSMMDDEEYGHDCNQIVQDRLIELFQEWALIFQSDPSLSYLYDTYTTLKNQKRVTFPTPSKNLDQVDPLSIVSSLAPPEWSDSPTCQRCRDAFTITNRKHHCRKCGGTFCQLCSSNEMPLLEMGINESVRVCDTCYREPTARQEKRKAKVFEVKPFEENSEDAELKKAIELSLKEQTVKPKESDEEALKKAIEVSLKETGPNHMSPQNDQIRTDESKPKLEDSPLHYLNQIELENISMFHQLIGRLVRTRPHLTPEDAIDLKKLAMEMRRLQKRPIEEENVKVQLEESLRGYEILFGPIDSHSPPQSVVSASDNGSKDLNQMRAELIGPVPPVTSVTPATSNDLKQVRSRIGSLSLENQINEMSGIETQKPTYQHPVAPVQAPIYQQPIVPAYHTNTPEMITKNPIPVHPSNTIPTVLTSTPIPLHRSPAPHIQMCPEMTIHPHPVHPFTHENPYAAKSVTVDTESEQQPAKKSKEKRSKKSKKVDKDKNKDGKRIVARITAKKHKNNKESKSSKKRIKRDKEISDSGKKRMKKEKDEDASNTESGEKRIKDKSSKKHKDKKSSDKEHKVDKKPSKKDRKEKKNRKEKKSKSDNKEMKEKKTEEAEDVVIEPKQSEEKEGHEQQKEPINLIDL